jgi:hypothetical protein
LLKLRLQSLLGHKKSSNFFQCIFGRFPCLNFALLEQSQKLPAMLAMGLLALGSYSLWLVKEHIAIKSKFSKFLIFFFFSSPPPPPP